MGFFTGLFGGSESKSTSQSGLNALPAYAQKGFGDLITQGSNLLMKGNGADMFRPLGVQAPEQQAFDLSLLPTTAQGVQSLVGNYMNPYTSFLTDEINKQAQGQNSIYQKNLAAAGQMGSNRQFLNAGEMEKNRLNAIGENLAGQYNNAQNTALEQNQQAITNLANQGGFLRQLGLDQAQAPLQALNAFAQLLQALPQTSQSKSTSFSTDGVLKTMQNGAKIAATGGAK